MLTGYKLAVTVERNALQESLNLLKQYIDPTIRSTEIPSIPFSELADEERKRLIEERDAKQKLLDILNDRINNNFGEE